MNAMRSKKASNTIAERIANLRIASPFPIGKHASVKTIFAIISILIIVALVAITGNFGSINNLASADSVEGIGVGIYWNQACTNVTHSLNWERMNAGSANNLTVYIRNEANSAVKLSLGTTNWTPSTSSDYISLNWNYSGQVLSIGQLIPLELTLTVSPTINEITDFSFNTIITTTER